MANNKREKIICFDLDGVLVDSSIAHAASFNLAFEANSLPKIPEQALIAEFGPPAETIVKKFFPNIDEDKVEKIVKDKRKFLVTKTAKLAKPIPGCARAIKVLKKTFKIALYTHCEIEEIEALLKAAKLKKELFDAILDKSKIHIKPDLDIINKIEEVVGGQLAWVVGDTTYDIELGREGEVSTIAVLTGVHSLQKLRAANPTAILESVALIPLYLGLL
ncbi:MAG: HAD family hydrolase [Candidatus Nanoarchaeia archaeon]